ncbi:MAG: glycine cleavage system protein GcvH [Chlamydiales bacterium]|nr:glycine cleavage system protein GcvH [Chlamydiia bacterium]MCP5508628.1 glycine cleavage system protein GcvH [Chlamydiales bacterium]
MIKYTESHEWIAVDGETGTVGITHHAQSELGDIVYVELPEVGKSVQAGEEVVVLESTKAAADGYAPISGTIIAVNERLKDEPELVNQSPEDDGWIFKMQIANADELNTLMDREKYETLI